MADLIQIGINVDTNAAQASKSIDRLQGSVVNNLKTVDRLERNYKLLDRALNNNKISAQQYAKGIQQVDAAIEQVLTGTQQATRATNQYANATRAATGAMNQYGKASAIGGKKLNRTNMMVQQAGYQFQDFAVQIQGGTNAFVALGQQGSQLLGIFGAKGAVLGAILAVGTAIARMGTHGKDISFDFKGFGQAIAKSFEPIQPAIDGIVKVLKFFGQVAVEAINLLINSLALAAVAFAGIRGVAVEFIMKAIDGFKLLGVSVWGVFNAIGKFAAEGMQVSLSAILGFANNAVAAYVGLKDSIVAVFGLIPSAVGDLTIKAVDGVLQSIETLLNTVIRNVNSFLDKIDAAIPDWMKGDGDALGRLVELDIEPLTNKFAGAASGAGEEISKAFTDAFGREFVKSDVTFLEDFISSTGRNMEGARREADALAKSLGAPVESVEQLFEAFKNYEALDIRDFFKMVAKETKGAGGAAEDLRKELDDPMVKAINSVSNAFGDFIANGLRDFKGFANSVLDSFKNMIAQMIATASRNKIMLSVGLGGSAIASQAAAGQLAGVGGASASGPIGSFVGSFAGGGAAGTGLLGGFGAAMPAALGGAGNGLFSVGANAAAAGGGIAASIGAVAAPLLAVAAVFSFFKKKVKELDSGLRVTVGNMDALVTSFKTTETKRFWGLSKKVSTSESDTSAAISDPIVNAVVSIQESVTEAAAAFGVAGERFDNFVYDFEVSLKGLTEDQKMQKLNEEFAKLGDSFTEMTGLFENMNDLMAVYQQRLDLEKQLLVAQGDVVELRKQELQTIHVLNRDLASRLHLLQAGGDMQSALTAFASGISQQQGLIRSAVEALVEPLQKAIDNTRSQAQKSYSIFRAAADSTRDEAENIAGIISSALDSRTIRSEAVERMRYTQAQQQLASFADGGSFDETSLRRATEGVSIDSTKFFGSFEDYARDFYKTQISLTKLSEKAEGELTDVEKQISIAEKAYQVAMGTYEEAKGFNAALNNLLNDLASYTEVVARNEPFIEQIKAEGDRQVELLDTLLTETTKQVNALLGIDTTIADLVGSNVSVGEALSILGLEGKDLAGAVFALKPTVDDIGSHVEDLDLTLGGAIDRLGLTLQDVVTLDLTAGFENLDLFAPLAGIDFGKNLQPILDTVSTIKGLDLSGPIAGVLSELSDLDLSGPIAGEITKLSELDLSGPIAGEITKLSELDLSGPIAGVLSELSDLDLASSLKVPMEGLSTNVSKLSDNTEKSATSVSNLSDNTEKSATNLLTLVDASGKLGTAVSGFSLKTDGLGIKIGNFGTTLSTAMGGLGSIVSGLSGAISGLTASNNAFNAAQAAADAAAKAAADAKAAAVAPSEEVKPEEVTIVSTFKGGPDIFSGGASGVVLSNGQTFQTKKGFGSSSEIANAIKMAKEAVEASGNIAAFASGGMHSGGLRIVGEKGPELEATGPSRIYSAQQTKNMLSGGSGEVVSELRSLRREVSEMKAEQRKIGIESVKYNKKSYDLNREWDIIGLPDQRT